MAVVQRGRHTRIGLFWSEQTATGFGVVEGYLGIFGGRGQVTIPGCRRCYIAVELQAVHGVAGMVVSSTGDFL